MLHDGTTASATTMAGPVEPAGAAGGAATTASSSMTTSSSSSDGTSTTSGVTTALTRGTVNQVARWGHSANRGVATVSRYLGRTVIARAAAATVTEMGRFTADRTREMLDYAALRLVKAGSKPLPPENGWSDVGRRLGSISAYELQMIDEKVRDVGLIEFADMLGVADPGELLHVAELRQRAAKGDEDAQYELAARFCPPPFGKRDRCKRCQKAFGVTRYRHHCRNCGESFCQDHSSFRHTIPKIGYMTPARVCHACKAQLEEEDLKDRIVWRMVRIEAFLQDRLILYFAPGDHTQLDKALRVVGDALSSAARKAPLRTTTALAAEAMELFGKYGMAGMAGILLRHEFVEAVEMLKQVSGVEVAWPVTGNQLSAAMYYLLGKGRGERGAYPDAEQEAHRGCPPISDGLLQDLLHMAPLALHFAYCDSPVEMQLKAQQQGWRLIFAHTPQVQPGQPAFAFYCHLTEKEACIVVRGPDHVQEVLSEIHGLPLPFPQNGASGGSGGKDEWARLSTEWLASCGIGEAAQWLFSEVYPHIRRLMAEGYSFTLLGHSLGGAVAALLGVLLREEGITDGVKCYTFGSPACVNAKLAQLCEAFSTTVILHDDVVPRITPTGVRGLLRDLLQEKETAEQHWQDDVEAIIVKSKGRWAPRWRRVSSRGKGGRSLSFVRSEEGEEDGDGAAARRRTNGSGPHETRAGTSLGTEASAGNTNGHPEDWDSCDDDFVDYWGVGCTREVSSRAGGAAANPNSYSIRHEDGTTTTVDLSAVRRRLLESSSSTAGSGEGNSSTATASSSSQVGSATTAATTSTATPPPRPPADEGVSATIQARGFASSSSSCEDGDNGEEVEAEEEEEEEEEEEGWPFQVSDRLDAESEEEEETHRRERGRDHGEEEEDSDVLPLAHMFGELDQQDEDQDETEADDAGAAAVAATSPSSFSSSSAAPASSPTGNLAKAPSRDASPPSGTRWKQAKKEEAQAQEAALGDDEGGFAYSDEEEEEDEEDESAVLVDDVNLPELYPPGRLVHIYSYRGVFKACTPPRDFPGLRHIALQGNLLRDHDPKAYFTALCEVIDVRRAPQDPPAWEGFKETNACVCCAVDLAWQCAAASEAHRYRDKHNCRCCGRLVCQGCSTHRMALPSIGLALPARVCDRCFFGGKQSAETPSAVEG